MRCLSWHHLSKFGNATKNMSDWKKLRCAGCATKVAYKLYRFVRPMFRFGSRNGYFNRRIPADVKPLAVGLRLSLPVDEEFVSVTISPGMEAIRLSLRTSDSGAVKARTAR